MLHKSPALPNIPQNDHKFLFAQFVAFSLHANTNSAPASTHKLKLNLRAEGKKKKRVMVLNERE